MEKKLRHIVPFLKLNEDLLYHYTWKATPHTQHDLSDSRLTRLFDQQSLYVVLYIWIFSTNKLTSVLLIKQWRSPEWPHPCWRCCARALVWPGRWPPFRPQLSVVSCRVVVVVVSRWRNAAKATVPPCRMSVKWWGIRTFVAVLCCGRFVLFVRFYWFSLSLRSMQWCCYLHNFVSRN